MAIRVKVLRLGDIIFQRQGSFTLLALQFVFSIALQIFFRRIELVNADALPEKSGLIFVMNHQNGLIDPALVFFTLPRKISFLAKSTIFQMPGLGFLARAVEALPVYRQTDAAEDMAKNQETFRRCRELLKKGGAIAVFPEGVSHNAPRLLPLKTGAARIALGAASVGERDVDLQILPVGIFYTNKTVFRSEAMLFLGASFPVPRVPLGAGGEPSRAAVKELTARIEEGLREVTVNAESQAEFETAQIAEKLFSSVYQTDDPEQTLAEKFEFLRDYVADTAVEDLVVGEGAGKNEKLEKRLAVYERKLGEYGLEPENLVLPQYSVWYAVKYFTTRFWFLVFLSPLALAGVILHFPAYQACKLLAQRYGRSGAEDIASTVKILAGMVLMPLTWVVLAVVLYFYADWRAAILAVPLAFLCGYAALRTLEEIEEMQGWIKAAWLFVSRREKFLRLLAERRNLHEALKSEKAER